MKKRILSIVLTLCMVCSLLPVSALAVSIPAPGEVSTWAELEAALSARNDAKLVADITCPPGSAGLVNTREFTLDLNGYTLNRGLTSAQENGYVIKAGADLVIKDTSPLKTGKITGGWNTGNGGGIQNAGYSTVTISDGVTICGNSANYGGGVFSSGLQLIVEGGTICHNNAVYGGGIYSTGSLSVSGVISDNTAERGGGIWTDVNNAFIRGCKITNNTAIDFGGGICYYHGSSLSENRNLRLQPNESESIEITGNKASQGGGIYAYENYGSLQRAGIIIGGKNEFNQSISGKIIIKDNTTLGSSGFDSDLVLANNFRLFGREQALTSDSFIKVTATDDSFYYDERTGAPLDKPSQINRILGGSGTNGAPYSVVYYGKQNGTPVAWYLMPSTNHVYGNAYFLWAKDSVGSQSFESVDESNALRLEVPETGFSEIDNITGILGLIGSSDITRHTWWNSTARLWLNDDFYEAAFSEVEKAAIIKTLQGSGNTVMNYNGVGISDKVFLLSAEELISPKYGFMNNLTNNTNAYDPAKNADTWYLMRTPYSEGPGWSNAVPGVISSAGTFYPAGVNATISQTFGMRPGINLDMGKVVFLAPATDLGSTIMNGRLSAVSGSENKVVLKDSDTFAVSNQSKNGNTISFNYSGASTGANRYITALVMDSTGTVKYMGNLAVAEESGTASLDLTGTTLKAGDKLYVCSNQENGDKTANYASNLVQLNLAEVHSVKFVSGAASCTSVGVSQDCWYCADCDTYFKDKTATIVLEDVEIAPVGHTWTYSPNYADDTHHWLACSACGIALDKEAHSFDANNACTVCELSLSAWAEFNSRLAAAENGSTITLTQNLVCPSADKDPLTFEGENRNVTLDLNGYTINGSAMIGKAAIQVGASNSSLTITDSSDAKTGKIIASIRGSKDNYAGNGIKVSGTGMSLTVKNISIVGNGNSFWGIVGGGSELLVDGCTISGFQREGITTSPDSPKAVITNSTITHNGEGLGVCNATFFQSKEVNISGCTFSYNNLAGYAAIRVDSTCQTSRIENCTVSNNTSGGITSRAASGTVSNCTISGNTEEGIYCAGPLTVKDCTISENDGVGIYCNAPLTVEGCTISNNGASDYYGGIQVNSGSLTLTNSVITGNYTEKMNGSAGLSVNGSVTLSGKVIIRDNYSADPSNKSNVVLENENAYINLESLDPDSVIGVRLKRNVAAGKKLAQCSDAAAAQSILQNNLIVSDVSCKEITDNGANIVWGTDSGCDTNAYVFNSTHHFAACSKCGISNAANGDGVAHTWQDATCTAPKTCSVCGAGKGEALGHTWQDATCDTPKTCSVCRTTEGELGHVWDIGYALENADENKHYHKCANCGATDAGQDHVPGAAATPTTPQTCTLCGYVLAEASGFAVKFDLNGHGEAIADQSVASGEKVSKPADPTVSGYIFGGWYKETSCINAWNFASDTVSQATTLYAKWTEKAIVSISEDVQTYTWDGTAKTFAISGTPGDGFAVQYKVNDNWTDTAPSAVGTYDVKVTRAEDETYKAYEKEITGGLVVNAAAPEATAPTAKTGLVYDGNAKSLINAGTSEHGYWEYSLDGTSYSSDIPTGTDAKTYTVYCRFVPNTGYTNIDRVELSVTIAPLPVDEPTVSGSYTYTGDEQTVTLNGVESYMTITGGNKGTNAGNYEVSITLDSNHAWKTDSDGKAQWHIGKADPTVTWPVGTAYVNDASVILTGGSVAGVGTETSVEGSFTLETVDLTSAGTKTVKITFTSNSTNYESAEKTDYIVTVSKRTVESVTEQTAITNAVYGTAKDSLGLPTSVTITTKDGKTINNVPVTWSGYDATNLNAQTLTGTLDLSAIEAEVQQADPAITASIVVDLQEKNAAVFNYENKTATYTGSPISHEISGEFEGVASISYSYVGTGETEYAVSSTAPVNTGTYEVTATFTMQPGYVAVASKTATLTISQKEVGLDWSELTAEELVYSGTAKALTATATGLADGDSCTVTVELVGDNINVGTFSYRATALTNANCKLPADVSSPAYTITPRTLTITADSHEVYVGSRQPELTYTVDGLVGDDALTTVPTLTTDANMNRAGTYAITFASEAAAGNNYSITYVNGTLTVKNYPYIVEIADDITGGEVSASKDIAYEGDIITITIAPDAGYELAKLTVTDSLGNAVSVTKVNDSKYTFKMPGYDVEIDAEFTKTDTTCPGDSSCPMYPYTDLDTGLWYHDGLHYCIEHGLMQGVGDNKFDPNGTTTRAMSVTILWRLEGSPVVSDAMNFEDVAADQWYTEAIRWAASENIVEGYGDGKFGTNDASTREQMVTIMWRYAKYKGYDVSVGENTNILFYDDAFDVAEWAIPAMQWACGSGIIQGIADGSTMNLAPQGNATRAQAAAILQRYVENVAKGN